MHKNVDIDAVSKIILETLQEDFVDVEILNVDVASDVDFDGDDILHVDVVFKGSPKAVDTSIFSGAVRSIKPKLNDLKVDAFPLFSFISDAEIKGKRIAAG